MGQRLNIILVAEGAIDRKGNAITADMVKKVQIPIPIFSCCSFQKIYLFS